MEDIEKISAGHPATKSADLIAENIEQLKQIFPEVIKEGKVDFEALQDLLGNYIDPSEERFCLNWSGKSNARREAQKRSTGTLRPCPEESVDWDTTQNLYIEGDNLEVLKLLQKSYHNAVKMIYIDPPYNTGKDFVYKDNYKDNMANYLEITGQDKSLSTNTESDGRYHSNWLNMMYPRLKLAHSLLKEDGVIFISIDDNEVANLRKLCDEIFGEDNFVECITWNKRVPKNDKGIGSIHEYVFIYVKRASVKHEFIMEKEGLDDIKALLNKLRKQNIPIKEAELELKKLYKKNDYDRGITLYNSIDEHFRLWGKINMSWPNANTFGPRYEILHPITARPVKIPDRGWRWKEDTFNEAAQVIDGKYQNINQLHDGSYVCGKIWFSKDEKTQPSTITYFEDVETFLLRSIISTKSDGGIELENMFEQKSIFSYPKSTSLLKTLIYSVSNESDEIFLDFFSGCATTAHAVMQLNAEDGGNRKYIMVQLPEQIEENSEAYKAGYKNICEIGKERIRRAGKKILEEQKGKATDLFDAGKPKLDVGFKVFKLDSSNINTWDGSPENLQDALFKAVQNIKADRSQQDLLYEILIKYGIDLVQPIKEHTFAGQKVYVLGAGALMVCLGNHISTDTVQEMAQLKKDLNPDVCRVVFKDTGFEDNPDKTNAIQILKQAGIVDVATV